MTTPHTSDNRPKRSWTSLWVGSTYFTEGLPYMLVRFLSSVFFTDMGVKEAYLGFLNFLGLPWNLKFIWAPLLDLFGTKRGWLLRLQLAIGLAVLLIAFLAGFGQGHDSRILSIIAFLFAGLAFLAATNDVAIDAYYLEGLTTQDSQAAYSGHRTLAYRAAVIFTRTVLVGIAGWSNWRYGFGAGAVTMLAGFGLHAYCLPHFESREKRAAISFSDAVKGVGQSFACYLRRDRVVTILVFIASYKLGDEILFSMNTPFLMRELGVTKPQIAWLAGIVGSLASIAGVFLGASWIRRKGLKAAIWPITIFMNINILAYLILSEGRPSASTAIGLIMIALVHAYENLAAGMGSAALTVYLMRLCDLRYKAAHFAIGTAIMSLGSTFIGGFGGLIVEKIGYTGLFLLGFLATIPSMALLVRVPLKD